MPTPEEIEAARLAEEQRLAAESQTQNQQSDIERLIQTSMADAERRAREAEQRARDLEDRLLAQTQNQVQNQNIQQTQNQSQDPQAFWQNPLDVINQAVSSQVKPLNDFVAQMQLQNQYTALKANYRQNPGFTAIESMVDGFMSGVQPTHANMQIAIQRAIGVLAMQGAFNQPVNNAPAPTNQNQNQDPAVVGTIPPTPKPIIPPHLRPSSPQNQPVDNKPKRRELTENERRILRETNMTEEKYWSLLEANNSVETWKEKAK